MGMNCRVFNTNSSTPNELATQMNQLVAQVAKLTSSATNSSLNDKTSKDKLSKIETVITTMIPRHEQMALMIKECLDHKNQMKESIAKLEIQVNKESTKNIESAYMIQTCESKGICEENDKELQTQRIEHLSKLLENSNDKLVRSEERRVGKEC